jgi:2-oxoglutarate/2-oxoacid ferredoxin oxidoreductase subunit alpha
VVEQNRDGQLRALLKLDMPVEYVARLRSVLHYNGLPIDARSVTDDVLVQEGLKAPAPRKAEIAAGVAVGGE